MNDQNAFDLGRQEEYEAMNTFATLAAIDCSAHLEKKGKFSYLSWPFAVRELRTAAPDATWRVLRFDGLPYLKTDCGYFVEVEVTVAGIALSQIHPVLNAQNRPIDSPTSFDINTSIQRCLVKAIALHGLGLFVYAGEDLPPGGAEPAAEECAPLTDDQIVALKMTLDTAETKDQLRALMRTAFASAKHDAEAHAAIKAYGMTIAANLGA
jgi:hypothetical protein